MALSDDGAGDRPCPGVLLSAAVVSEWGQRFAEVGAEFEPVLLARDGTSGPLATVEAAFLSADVYPDLMAAFADAVDAAPDLRWLHVFTAGADHPWIDGLRARGIRVTTSSGAAAVPIAQSVAMYILALSRGLDRWFDAQRRSSWEPHDVDDLAGTTLGIVGLGAIGHEVARLGDALGMRVVGLRRTPTGAEPCETWTADRFHELLEIVDYLVLALPGTPETTGLVDSAALRRMKPTARLVNVGRGTVVDESALVDALRHRRLAGAGLDVFEQEPLDPASPLWHLPGVLITPHASGQVASRDGKAVELFVDNLRLYLRGAELRNEVR